MNTGHILSVERILKSLFAGSADTFLTQNQMANWAGVILGQIPHCMEQTSSQMLGVLPRGDGRLWNRLVCYTFQHVKTVGKSSFFQ